MTNYTPEHGVLMLDGCAVTLDLLFVTARLGYESAAMLLAYKLLRDNPDWKILVVTDSAKTLSEINNKRIHTATTSEIYRGPAYHPYDAVIFDGVESCSPELLESLHRFANGRYEDPLWVFISSLLEPINHTFEVVEVLPFLTERMNIRKHYG